MTKNQTDSHQSKVERFKKERTILCALQLPKEMHDRVLALLARRAGL